MEKPKYQFEAEDQIIRDNLYKAGYAPWDINDMLNLIKDKTPEKKPVRNEMIKEISGVLRGNICVLQAWYVFGLLAKICGLSPGYIQLISYSVKPSDIIKKKAIGTN